MSKVQMLIERLIKKIQANAQEICMILSEFCIQKYQEG